MVGGDALLPRQKMHQLGGWKVVKKWCEKCVGGEYGKLLCSHVQCVVLQKKIAISLWRESDTSLTKPNHTQKTWQNPEKKTSRLI